MKWKWVGVDPRLPDRFDLRVPVTLRAESPSIYLEKSGRGRRPPYPGLASTFGEAGLGVPLLGLAKSKYYFWTNRTLNYTGHCQWFLN